MTTPDDRPCPACAAPELDWLSHVSPCPRFLEIEAAGELIPMGGPRHYQVHVSLPGGAQVLMGISGHNRAWARQDAANLTGWDEKHISVSKLPRRGRR